MSMAADRRYALESCRGAVLAIHAAAGLSLACSREAARLMRVAEGLGRTAISLMAASECPPIAAALEAKEAPRKPRRPRGRRKTEASNGAHAAGDGVGGDLAPDVSMDVAPAAAASVGGSCGRPLAALGVPGAGYGDGGDLVADSATARGIGSGRGTSSVGLASSSASAGGSRGGGGDVGSEGQPFSIGARVRWTRGDQSKLGSVTAIHGAAKVTVEIDQEDVSPRGVAVRRVPVAELIALPIPAAVASPAGRRRGARRTAMAPAS